MITHEDMDAKFTSIEQWERFNNKFASQMIISYKYTNLKYFAKENFPLIANLKSLELEHFVTLNVTYTKETTRPFYRNLDLINHPLGIKNKVSGVHIKINGKDLVILSKFKVMKVSK